MKFDQHVSLTAENICKVRGSLKFKVMLRPNACYDTGQLYIFQLTLSECKITYYNKQQTSDTVKYSNLVLYTALSCDTVTCRILQCARQ